MQSPFLLSITSTYLILIASFSMSASHSSSSSLFFCFLIFFTAISPVISQGSIGVCNGRFGNNLPSEKEVVDLYKSNNIKKMRIYAPDQATLTALRDSDIELILDVPNSELESLQSDAANWVQTNVRSHFPATKIRYISVGNEVDPEKSDTSRFVPLVLPAMRNIHRALTEFGLQDQIKVSTATYSALLADTSPPSNTRFKDLQFMEPIVRFLAETRAPLLTNIYPYFAYKGDRRNIKLDFALFTSPGVVVQDGNFGYQNLFDAMVDGVYYALEKAGAGNVEVVVSESGWPSDGDGGATASVENAGTYYRNLIGHVGRGTPKRAGKATETYLFAMFDENTKPGDKTEQHFGVFNPVTRGNKYQLTFNN